MSTTSLRVDESLRQAFESAWMAGTVPEIRRHLPPVTAVEYLGTLEELVHIDLELRWKNRAIAPDSPGKATASHDGPRIEYYLKQFPVLDQRDVLVRLLQQELWVRSRYASAPEPDEYAERFPSLGDASSIVSALQTAAAPQEARYAPGQQCGRYLLLQMHARGGFGEVWRAYDPLLEREVALKTLSERQSRQADAKRRFVSEARTTARLEHPGVVSVHDLNQVEDELPYYAMRFLGGQTLAQAVAAVHGDADAAEEERNVQRARLLSAFLTITRTVEFAHSRGVVHRDLKPQNVILGEYGETAILDWGLAKRRDAAKKDDQSADDDLQDDPLDPESSSLGHGFAESMHATRDGTVMGTPAYMSPEQSEGLVHQVDELSDQYSLGVMLFNLLTATTPAECGERFARTGLRVRPRSIVPSISPALEAICLKAMSFDRASRYESVSALTRDLELYLAGEPVSAYAEPWQARLMRWVRRNRTMVSTVATAAAVATALLTLGVILLLEANRRLSQQRNRAETALGVANENLYDHRVGGAYAELAKNNVVRAEEMLSACPEARRDWEWHYIDAEIKRHKPDRVLSGERSIPRTLVFSDDGSYLASGFYNGTTIVWGVRSWEEQARIHEHDDVRGMAFSPNGSRLLVIGAHGTSRSHLISYELSTSRVIRRKQLATDVGYGVRFDHQGQLLVAMGSSALVLDPETWETVTTLLVDRDAAREVLPVGERDDGQIESSERPRGDSARSELTPAILVRDSREVTVWSDTSKLIRTVDAHRGRLFDADYNIARQLVAAAGIDFTVSLWNLDRPKLKPVSLIGHTDTVRAVAFTPDGETLASGGYDRTIRIWDTRSRLIQEVIRSHTSHVRRLAFSPMVTT